MFDAMNLNFEFVRFNKPDKIVAWKVPISKEGHYNMGIIKVQSVDIDTLKFLGVWEQLSKEVQDSILNRKDLDIREKQERMEHARKHRRNKYENVPKEIKCSICGTMIKVAPGLLFKRIEKMCKEKNIAINIDDYIKVFKCQVCCPTKGRKSTGKCVPIELVCKCGNKVTYPKNILMKQAEKRGVTLEEHIKGYACQKCKPTKFGKGKRGRPKGSGKKKA